MDWFTELNIASKKVQSVIIWDFVNFGNELQKMTYLPTNFEMELNADTNVDDDWKTFVNEQREKDISTLITEERLKDEEARKFIDNAFRDGLLRTTGTDIDKIMPPVSRFGGGNRAEKKNGIIAKLTVFFEKYLGLV